MTERYIDLEGFRLGERVTSLPSRFVALDIEESERLKHSPSIVLSVGLAEFNDGELVRSTYIYVNNGLNNYYRNERFHEKLLDVTETIQDLTGIDNALIDAEGVSLEDAFAQIKDWVEPDTVIVGQSVYFDLSSLAYNALRFDLYEQARFIGDLNYFDTYETEVEFNHNILDRSLASIAAYYKIPFDVQHNGKKDAIVSGRVAMAQRSDSGKNRRRYEKWW